MTEHDVRRTLRRVNPRKAAEFNLFLSQCIVPNCFKQSVIVPVPKKPQPSCLNDYCPIALTSVVMKCFERSVKPLITSSLPATLDPWQFTYRPNRFTDDTISHLVHTIEAHLDTKRGSYARLLFIDYRSAFNTIILTRLLQKPCNLSLHPSLCQWIHSFLTERSQVVCLGRHVLPPHPQYWLPQGCILSPLLYPLYTYDCTATLDFNTIFIKFAQGEQGEAAWWTVLGKFTFYMN